MKSQTLLLTCLLAAGLTGCQPKQETQEGLGAGGNPELRQDSVTYADTMGYAGWDSVNADTGRTGAAPKY